MSKAIGWIAGLAGCLWGCCCAAPVEVFNFGRFGPVAVYGGDKAPREVVLLLSGDGGWDTSIESMAQQLADTGVLVAGIDSRHYFAQLETAPEKCVSPAADFENLNHYFQSKRGLEHPVKPTLVGYSAGASLAYATLAAAPESLFKGALSIGFCPDLDLNKPLCKGSGLETTPRRDAKGAPDGVMLQPARHLAGKWVALQGGLDEVCPAGPAQKFTASMPGGDFVALPHMDHGALASTWAAPYESALRRVTSEPREIKGSGSTLPPQVADLPLIIVPAAHAGASPWFGIFLSGDGGWVGIDKGVSKELANHDIPIVGWDSLKYFWSKRTPEGSSRDLDRVMRYYAKAWNKSHALLIGYSQGADTMPFMINRLPPATHELVGYTTLMGISDNAVFEFHVANWVGNATGGIPTAPELAHWSGAPYLCIYGESDGDAACPQLIGKGGVSVKLPGGHHFGGGYSHIAAEILSRLPKY